MKRILVPTDFSDPANNALEYAFNLASQTGASVTILNVYHVPLPSTEAPLMLISPEEILERTNERLNELAAAARTVYEKRFLVNGMAREGFAADEIAATASQLNADLVIMGTTGTSSVIGALLGSVSTAVMKKCTVPVLVVPSSAHFSSVKRIAFAFDYKEPCKRATGIIKEYAQRFNAEVSVVNVVAPNEEPHLRTALAGMSMDEVFAGTRHHLYFLGGTDVAHELSVFIDHHQPHWLVVVPRAHGFFGSLFHRSIANRAAMKIGIPILSVHEQ